MSPQDRAVIDSKIAAKPLFAEPPPSCPVTNPEWAEEFTNWWARKCAYYDVDVWEAFEYMLEEPQDAEP